jgi:hypothetical protein
VTDRVPSARDQVRLAKGAAALKLPGPRTAEERTAQIQQLDEAIAAMQSLDDLGEQANARAMADLDVLLEMLRVREGLSGL